MKIKQLLLSLSIVFSALAQQNNPLPNGTRTPKQSSFSRFAGTACAVGTAVAFWSVRDQGRKNFILSIQDRNKLAAASLGCLVGRVALSELVPRNEKLNWISPVLQGLLTGYGALGMKKVIEGGQPNEQDPNRRRRWLGIDYNNIRLWQVLGVGSLINKYVAHLQGQKYSSSDTFDTAIWWWIFNI